MQETTTSTEVAPVKVGHTKILGYWVKLGTKRHSILVQTKKHLDDLRTAEISEWKNK